MVNAWELVDTGLLWRTGHPGLRELPPLSLLAACSLTFASYQRWQQNPCLGTNSGQFQEADGGRKAPTSLVGIPISSLAIAFLTHTLVEQTEQCCSLC